MQVLTALLQFQLVDVTRRRRPRSSSISSSNSNSIVAVGERGRFCLRWRDGFKAVAVT